MSSETLYSQTATEHVHMGRPAAEAAPARGARKVFLVVSGTLAAA